MYFLLMDSKLHCTVLCWLQTNVTCLQSQHEEFLAFQEAVDGVVVV